MALWRFKVYKFRGTGIICTFVHTQECIVRLLLFVKVAGQVKLWYEEAIQKKVER